MNRMLCVLAGVVLLPRVAVAQGVPVAPLPPTPPAPVIAPVPPAPPAAPWAPAPPMAPFRVTEDSWRLFDLQDRLFDLSERRADVQARVAAEARAAAQIAIDNDINLRNFRNDFRWEGFELQRPAPRPGPGPVVVRAGGGDERGMYNNGLSALQNRQYDRAIMQFDRVIAVKGTYADAATYWKAFSQARLVRTDDALASIASLRRDYPQSRYLPEAKVLEADVRRLAGQPVDPQTLDANDELKLIAINGIANTDPERAIPLLETVLNGANTLGNKRRALFVLALIKDPRAHQILLRYAKGAGSPELQAEAIRNLVSRRDSPASDAELRDIYESAQDPAIRRAVIEAYGNAGNKTALVAVIKSRSEIADNKRTALNRLQNLAAPTELWTIYQGEQDPELRMQIANVFASMGATDQLMLIVKSEKEPKVRLRAVRNLGSQNTDATGAILSELYGSEQDRDTKRSIISAFRAQNNATALVTIARKETNLELKREIVSAISDMAGRDKVAADYLMEMVK
jgi:HEAT repeat protein